ncbi:MAG: GNAT family N-acetyltransferase [Proteobacteria bacterium]|nr:GNAT family N-acetyltransferase [Pseudomonadota bacterium]MDA1057804.1 GNAT family N-acetyltransferase [Pseudomonadota bacterium]
MHATKTEWLTEFDDDDLDEICEATEQAIEVGIGFDWISPPPRDRLESYWRGVLLVPERELLVGRYNGTVAGTAQMVRPAPNNQAGAHNVILNSFFVAPWARGHGLARDMLDDFEKHARTRGFRQISLDVRETQEGAIALYENAGFVRWGIKPNYALVGGQFIRGFFYTKDIGA